MKRVLITGGSGFVGRNLVTFFADRFLVSTTYFQHPVATDAGIPSFCVDIRDAEAVSSVIARVKPDVVIHAAGNKNVRFCEDHPDEANLTNAQGTQNLARSCRNSGARMIYLSTDLVFGCATGDYKEDDLPQPTLAYGRSKLLGEHLALEALEDVAICRSGGIYGKGSPLLSWFSSEINAGRTVECFVDVFNTPTYLENLAEMIEVILSKQLSGVFHTVGRERVSRFQFFQTYADTFGLDASLLAPISTAGVKDRIFLQPDSSLSVDQTSERLSIRFNSPRGGFARLKASGGI